MASIAAAFEDDPAFIPYLAAGDPDFAASQQFVEAVVDAGADIVELGLPFSDPVADGPTIREATVRALEAGMTPTRYFEFVRGLSVEVPIVTMTYYNLIYQYGDTAGPEAFVTEAAAAGIDGLIVPDLPVEEAEPLARACAAQDRKLIFIVAPTTTAKRLEQIQTYCSGYVYLQARLGTTGARSDLSNQTGAVIDRVADWSLPKAVGFGISTPEQAAAIVNAGADGIIVGSALIDRITDGLDAGKETDTVAKELETYARSLATGAKTTSVANAGGGSEQP